MTGVKLTPRQYRRHEKPYDPQPFFTSLRVRGTLTILIPILMIMGVSTAVEYFRHRERNLKNMSLLASQTGQVIENILQQDMLLSDFARLQTTFDDISKDERIRRLYLMDTDGKVVIAPNNENVGEILNAQDETCQPCHSLLPSDRPSGIVVSDVDGQRYFRSMHPIENQPACTACHDADQRLIGVLLTDFSFAPVENALTADVRDNLIWWIGTAIVMALLVNLAINRTILRRIYKLGQAIANFDRQDQTLKLDETPDDEIGRLSSIYNAMADRIGERDKENRALTRALNKRIVERGILLQRLITAQEEERKRVARELHDELGQGLSSTALSIELAQKLLTRDLESADENLQRAQVLISETSDQMYDLILGLRPSALDDLGLEAALRSLTQRTLEPKGVAIDLKADVLTDRLPAEVETVLFRVFQEALTNVVRHACAENVILRLVREDHHLKGEITDDGVGFDLQTLATDTENERGLGLLGMRERVEQFGGEIEIHSQPGEGTRIRVYIPIEETADDGDDQDLDR
ncbi:MAG: HAMP domain-containing protein [Anaerolineales bacterium]|nr:HAMP domain-containing protein [Anaerolineales bacterium]